jgi:hypothetical protein
MANADPLSLYSRSNNCYAFVLEGCRWRKLFMATWAILKENPYINGGINAARRGRKSHRPGAIVYTEHFEEISPQPIE